jgi:hypothetical protein
VLLQPDKKTQAWIRISIPDNSFCVTLRGSSESSCLQFMSEISSEVAIGCQPHPAVSFRAAVRSPFSSNTLIPVDHVFDFKATNQQLLCPETHFPLHPGVLLQLGGYLGAPSTPGIFTFSIHYFSCWGFFTPAFVFSLRTKMVGGRLSFGSLSHSLCGDPNVQGRPTSGQHLSSRHPD